MVPNHLYLAKEALQEEREKTCAEVSRALSECKPVGDKRYQCREVHKALVPTAVNPAYCESSEP